MAHSAEQIELIVTADDLGVCDERNRGIVHCLQQGVVSATSAMCNAPAAVSGLHAVGLISLHALECVGLHLNLTEGFALAPAAEVSSLVKRATLSSYNGAAAWEHSASAAGRPCFLGKAGFSQACVDGIIDPKQVVREARAQIEWFRSSTGRLPSHVDGHQHCHIEPLIAEDLALLFAEYSIPAVRIPEERGYDHLGIFCSRCLEVQALCQSARAVYSSHGIKSPDAYLGCSLCGVRYLPADFIAALDKQIALLRSSKGRCSAQLVIEAMCHPGFSAPGQWDEFSASVDREIEIKTLCDPVLQEALARRGVVLHSYASSSLSSGDA
mmetsp:Transcript_22686/g.46503  ORF Transcript_22686/g.46503 Transcript_22686/m.46503 type:complete len:326 (+) Transcript_22686:81-1058(+)